MKYQAILVRGSHYSLATGQTAAIVFEKDKPQEVTPEQRAHLERHAFDMITIDYGPAGGGKQEKRLDKFKFEPVRARRPKAATT